MILKTEKNPVDLEDAFIIKKLHKLLPQDYSHERYHDLLCDLILKGKSSEFPEITVNGIAADKDTNTIQETLFKRLYNSWMSIHKTAPFKIAHDDDIPKILVWGYNLKLNNQKAVLFKFLQFHQFKLNTLTAFWAAINFAQIESLEGTSCFGNQSQEQFDISCKNIAGSHLTTFKFEFHGFRVSIAQVPSLWQAIKSSKIEHLGLHRYPIYMPDRPFWELFCNALKDSKIKSLSLAHNHLYHLSCEQWNLFYEALSTLNLEFLDISYNHLLKNGSSDENTINELKNKFNVIGKIINLPTLKHLKWLGSDLNFIPAIHLSVFQFLETSHLEHLEISPTYPDILDMPHSFPLQCDKTLHFTTNSWNAFIASLKKLKLKSLSIVHAFPDEISSDIFQSLCGMICESNLHVFSLIHQDINFIKRLSSENWRLLSKTFKRKDIKEFNFSWVELFEENFTGFSEFVLTSGIESLNLQNNRLENYSPDWWANFAKLIEQSNITTLDLKQNRLGNMKPAAWKHFCHMIEHSSLRALHIDLYKSHGNEVTFEEINLFSQAIKNSSLKTLVIDIRYIGDYFWHMELQYIEQIFDAIKRSKISKLIIDIPDTLKRLKPEIEKIALDCLRVENNKAKLSLFGLAANTLFGRHNARLTDTEIIYTCNDEERCVELPDEMISKLGKFI